MDYLEKIAEDAFNDEMSKIANKAKDAILEDDQYRVGRNYTNADTTWTDSGRVITKPSKKLLGIIPQKDKVLETSTLANNGRVITKRKMSLL